VQSSLAFVNAVKIIRSILARPSLRTAGEAIQVEFKIKKLDCHVVSLLAMTELRNMIAPEKSPILLTTHSSASQMLRDHLTVRLLLKSLDPIINVPNLPFVVELNLHVAFSLMHDTDLILK
jgi:hypothetical protein